MDNKHASFSLSSEPNCCLILCCSPKCGHVPFVKLGLQNLPDFQHLMPSTQSPALCKRRGLLEQYGIYWTDCIFPPKRNRPIYVGRYNLSSTLSPLERQAHFSSPWTSTHSGGQNVMLVQHEWEGGDSQLAGLHHCAYYYVLPEAVTVQSILRRTTK